MRIPSVPRFRSRSLSLAILVALPAPSARCQEAARPDVARLFADWSRDDCPGAAVAVVKDGKVVFRGGYGVADLERGVGITPSTRFEIASVSKQFTAFAVATLAHQGVLALEDDVRKHLPEVPDFGDTITLRHLLHHTSGLRDAVELMLMSGYAEDDMANRARYWRLIRAQRDLNFRPGSAYQYSNTGYFLLAEVVACVTGKSFRSWMQANVFEPLGMKSSHVKDRRTELIRGRAHGYTASQSSFVLSPTNDETVGGGGIVSTVEDLARWILHLEAGVVGGKRVLTTLTQRGRLNGGEEVRYALGLIVDEHRGLRRVGHSGRAAGFLSYLAYYPGQRFGVVILCNGYPMRPLLNPMGISERIAELYLKGAMRAAESPIAVRPDVVELSADQRQQWAGWYWHPERNYMRRIVHRQGELLFVTSSGHETALLAIAPGRFVLRERGRRRIQFRDGTSRKMTVTNPGRTADTFVAVPAPAPPGEKDLEAYVGSYYSPELRVTHEFVVRAGRLVICSMGRGESVLRPVIRDHFNQGSPWWFGYDIHFQRGVDGIVTGLRVSNYHAKNVRFDKVRR